MSFSPQGKAEVNTKAFCIPRRRLSQMCRVVLVHHMALWCPHTTWHRHVHTLHGTATWNYSAPTQHNQFSSKTTGWERRINFTVSWGNLQSLILSLTILCYHYFQQKLLHASLLYCLHRSCFVCKKKFKNRYQENCSTDLDPGWPPLSAGSRWPCCHTSRCCFLVEKCKHLARWSWSDQLLPLQSFWRSKISQSVSCFVSFSKVTK